VVYKLHFCDSPNNHDTFLKSVMDLDVKGLMKAQKLVYSRIKGRSLN
jgi:hypothetical protein